MSALITLLFTSLYLFIIYEQRQAVVNEGMSRLQTRMMDIFNDNELIADATGVRYHQIKNAGQCGNLSRFSPEMRIHGESMPTGRGSIPQRALLFPVSPILTLYVCLRRRSLFGIG
ncbi:Uncharacterised protein [Citrobacter koseri]|uniref:Uncharacterized protein n=1 Tax=Citrobacter koseri TaxID=545 RepID=A0A3S4M4N1_CITKO|nr:Uncharacterised protein [Citrobacter koseri]